MEAFLTFITVLAWFFIVVNIFKAVIVVQKSLYIEDDCNSYEHANKFWDAIMVICICGLWLTLYYL